MSRLEKFEKEEATKVKIAPTTASKTTETTSEEEPSFRLVSRGSGDLKTRYRPHRLEELAPTCSIQQLRNIINNPNASQIYLFEGKTGAGKTTCARIVAKASVCESADKPCLKCRSCLNFDTCSDFIEMNVADHRKIDDAREMSRDITYLPQTIDKKIYILDEVQQLTEDAQQQLLKVLEQPPKHLLMFLCTTDKKGLIQTLIDRTTSVTFKPITIAAANIIIKQVLEAAGKEASLEIKLSFFKNCHGSARALLNNIQKYIEGGYDPDQVEEEDDTPIEVKEIVAALSKKDWAKTNKILKKPRLRKESESIRMQIESYVRAVVLNKDVVAEAKPFGNILEHIVGNTFNEPEVSKYNQLVLKCWRICS